MAEDREEPWTTSLREGKRVRGFVALMLGEELGLRVLATTVEALGVADERGRRAGVATDFVGEPGPGGGRTGGFLRFPRPEGLHLTLYFLGDVERDLVDRLADALAPRISKLAAPRLMLTRGGAFPETARGREPAEPSVYWVGVRGLVTDEYVGDERQDPVRTGRVAALEPVRDATLAALDSIGVDTRAERRRPFRPHVTVGRPRVVPSPDPARTQLVLAALRQHDFGVAWRPSSVAVAESVRAERGPQIYRVLREVPFAKRSARHDER